MCCCCGLFFRAIRKMLDTCWGLRLLRQRSSLELFGAAVEPPAKVVGSVSETIHFVLKAARSSSLADWDPAAGRPIPRTLWRKAVAFHSLLAINQRGRPRTLQKVRSVTRGADTLYVANWKEDGTEVAPSDCIGYFWADNLQPTTDCAEHFCCGYVASTGVSHGRVGCQQFASPVPLTSA